MNPPQKIRRSAFARLLFTSLCLLQTGFAEEGFDPVFTEWRSRVDPAVENGLSYLSRIQKEDGSFPENYGDSTGVPALVGMAFLSKGHMPTEGPYVTTINKCVDFILANQKENGLFEKGGAGSGPM